MKVSDKGEVAEVRVIIENDQKNVRVDESMLKMLENTVCLCLKQESFSTACEIGITLVDNKRIGEINSEFRHIDAPTDVLSFPMVEMEDGRIISTEGDLDMDEKLLLMGDIVISLEKACEQAGEYSHSFERELSFLTSHGVFHLLGYDHESEQQEKVMLGKQEKVLDSMGLTRA